MVSAPAPRPVAFIVTYDGSPYTGSQKQPHKRTVQDKLEAALAKLWSQPIPTVASGRTDSGVHASEYWLLARLPPDRLTQLGFENLGCILNKSLPPTIKIKRYFIAPAHFHPRFSACVRLYQYRLLLRPAAHTPYTLGRSYYYPYPVEKTTFQRILHTFEGTHNFTTFSDKDERKRSKIRTLYKIDCIEYGHELVIELYGNAFLKGMIRSIIGNALFLARKDATPAQVLELFEKCDPSYAKARAPGYALTLERVFYTPLRLPS